MKYIFSDKRESYITVLPLVDISVILCKDKEVVFPQIEMIYLLIAREFIDFCQRKGKVIFKQTCFFFCRNESITVALHFLGV